MYNGTELQDYWAKTIGNSFHRVVYLGDLCSDRRCH